MVTEQSVLLCSAGSRQRQGSPDSALGLRGEQSEQPPRPGVSGLFPALHPSLDALGSNSAPLACPHLPSLPLGPPGRVPARVQPPPGQHKQLLGFSPSLSRHKSKREQSRFKMLFFILRNAVKIDIKGRACSVFFFFLFFFSILLSKIHGILNHFNRCTIAASV